MGIFSMAPAANPMTTIRPSQAITLRDFCTIPTGSYTTSDGSYVKSPASSRILLNEERSSPTPCPPVIFMTSFCQPSSR